MSSFWAERVTKPPDWMSAELVRYDSGTLWHTLAHSGTLWHTLAHSGTDLADSGTTVTLWHG